MIRINKNEIYSEYKNKRNWLVISEISHDDTLIARHQRLRL